MIEFISLMPQLQLIQLCAAVLLVPLFCWLYTQHGSRLCRWSLLLAGYLVQAGFFLTLDDAGFSTCLLVFMSTLVACLSIFTMASIWPTRAVAVPIAIDSEPQG